jgi:outer membrane protein OmpA-like peptidoglycan-associated protein
MRRWRKLPGPTTLILSCSALTPRDLATAWSDHAPADLKLVIITACQTSVLWPDHRARLLQALIDHDAFDSLRHDVAWKIIDWTFDVPRPPRVLRQCAALAVEQVDFAVIAHTWLASALDEAAACTREPYTGYLRRLHDVACHRQETTPSRSTGARRTRDRSTPALDSPPARAALTAGPTRPAAAAQADTPAEARHSPRQARAHTRRLPPRPYTPRKRPGTTAARKHRHMATSSGRRLAIIATAAITVAAVFIALFLGALQRGNGSFLQPRLAGDPGVLQQIAAPRYLQVVTAAVRFDPNSTTLEPGTDASLRIIAQQIQSQDLAVSITGYASPSEDIVADNLALSARRAVVVRDWLISLDVPAAQIIYVGSAMDSGLDWKAPKPDSAIIVLSRKVKNP